MLQTKRTSLRPFTITDYSAVFEFGSNPEVAKYTGDELLQNPQQAKDIITNVYESDYKKYGYGRWATVYKPDNKVIGFAGLKYLPEFDEVDIGFRFLPQYWNKGIATEVSLEIIKYGFETLKLNRIIGIADPLNLGSCKVLEKIGLQFYKSDDYNGDGKNYNYYQLKKENYSQA